MHFNWYGYSSCKLQEGGVTVVIDPFKEGSAKSPRMAADLLLLSQPDFEEAASSVSGDKFLIKGPGEYEVKGIFVTGLPINGQTLFYIDVFGLKVVHLGRMNKSDLTDKQLEMVENCDVLIIPVGGHDTLNEKSAAALVNRIEPKIIVPICHHVAALKDKYDPIDKFKKEVGMNGETVDKLSIKVKDIPQEESKLYIVEASV
ncbi:MAG: MBL fold metallo-hydrolase [Candidatus Komeilibacteria bacterium]|nr:MBL fold metallo-hydrolase [Candidatus Komeilibacteria bacterium]